MVLRKNCDGEYFKGVFSRQRSAQSIDSGTKTYIIFFTRRFEYYNFDYECFCRNGRIFRFTCVWLWENRKIPTSPPFVIEKFHLQGPDLIFSNLRELGTWSWHQSRAAASPGFVSSAGDCETSNKRSVLSTGPVIYLPNDVFGPVDAPVITHYCRGEIVGCRTDGTDGN